MTKPQSIALYLIAFLLVVDFAITHVRPVIVLTLNERAYLNAARKCHEHLYNWEQARSIGQRVDKETAFALAQSAEIGLMECYEKESLRRDLLAQGISTHELARISLKARNQSNAGLGYFVQGLASGK